MSQDPPSQTELLPPPPGAPQTASAESRLAGGLRTVGGWLTTALAWAYRCFCRPRVRLTVIGGLLVLTGALLVTSSVWTLPMLIVGAAMLVVAWVGARLDGRFAVQWGETGTEFELRAEIKAPAHATIAGNDTPQIAASDTEPASEDTVPDADVVEGEAHTIEIDVAELKALIAAAEATASTAEAGSHSQAA